MLDDGIVVSRHEIEYLAPLTFRPDRSRSTCGSTRVHGAGFDLGYDVRDPASMGDAVYAVAETGLVLYDFATPARAGSRRGRAHARGAPR